MKRYKLLIDFLVGWAIVLIASLFQSDPTIPYIVFVFGGCAGIAVILFLIVFGAWMRNLPRETKGTVSQKTVDEMKKHSKRYYTR